MLKPTINKEIVLNFLLMNVYGTNILLIWHAANEFLPNKESSEECLELLPFLGAFFMVIPFSKAS